MPKAPDKQGGAAKEDEEPPPSPADSFEEEWGDGDHHDVEGKEVAAFPEQEDIAKEGHGIDEVAAEAAENLHHDEDHGAQVVDGHDVE
jgi:hypothetical protein